MKSVTAAEANREFSALLRRVRAGESIVVTSHGRPVAKIVPLSERSAEEREAAKQRLLNHLRTQPIGKVVPPRSWTRESLYERGGRYEDDA